jgi:hypothetical protein
LITTLRNIVKSSHKCQRVLVKYKHNRKGKPMDEQAEEIREALAEYYANPEDYTLSDFEEIFQDRDPFEFL